MTNHDAPICTQEAARAAGLDVAPAPDELASMAARIVEMWGDRWAEPDDEVASVADAGAQLARAVPLLLAKLGRLQTWHENYKAGTRMAGSELRKRLTAAEAEHDELKEQLLTAQGDIASEAARADKAEGRLETARQSARREEMTRQKRDAQIIILGDQLKKRGVTNAEISEWIESVS